MRSYSPAINKVGASIAADCARRSAERTISIPTDKAAPLGAPWLSTCWRRRRSASRGFSSPRTSILRNSRTAARQSRRRRSASPFNKAGSAACGKSRRLTPTAPVEIRTNLLILFGKILAIRCATIPPNDHPTSAHRSGKCAATRRAQPSRSAALFDHGEWPCPGKSSTCTRWLGANAVLREAKIPP